MTITRVALVTGANRGIGYETCRQLAEAGMDVVLTARDPNHGEKAARSLSSEGRRVRFHRLDVARRESIEKAIEWVEHELGRLDVLVNNAGVLLDDGVRFLEVEPRFVEDTLRVNFWGPFHLCRAVVPLMEANRYGRIVNVSSGSGALHDMGGLSGAYKVSKTALNALTRIVADEVDERIIKVNAVTPGWVRTDMGGSSAGRKVKEGAEGVVWAALLPDDGPTGGFFRDGRPEPW